MKMVFVASIIRHKLCVIYAFFEFFAEKSFPTKNYFLTAEIHLTNQGPLYTCLIVFDKNVSFLIQIVDAEVSRQTSHISVEMNTIL